MPISDDQMNTIMQNISANIPTECSTYADIRDKSEHATPVLGIDEFNISAYEAYRNDIEFVNSFAEQVLIDEEVYFVKKYSQKVYDFLKTQRSEYSAQERINKTNEICGDPSTNCPATTNTVTNSEQAAKDKQCSDSNNFLSYLLSQTKSNSVRPETIYKKIEYRNESHEFLVSLNYYMTVFYFAILILMMVLLTTTNRLMIRERFMLYLFLFILPFVFPYLFELLKYLYGSVFPDSPDHGPKNAFLESY
jgi:hypothetical protein